MKVGIAADDSQRGDVHRPAVCLAQRLDAKVDLGHEFLLEDFGINFLRLEWRGSRRVIFVAHENLDVDERLVVEDVGPVDAEGEAGFATAHEAAGNAVDAMAEVLRVGGICQIAADAHLDAVNLGTPQQIADARQRLVERGGREFQPIGGDAADQGGGIAQPGDDAVPDGLQLSVHDRALEIGW
jgi:hypothetical protein